MEFFKVITLNIGLLFESVQLIEIINPILSFIGVCISAIILKATINSLREQNRPFISFSIEPTQKVGNLFIVIRNTGNRTANNVKITSEPKLKSICSQKRKIPLIISENGDLMLSGISPNQTIKSFFDSGLYRYKEKTNDKVEITICYEYKKTKYLEKTTIDFSYLKNASSINSPEDIGKNIKKIADNIEALNNKFKDK